MLIDRRNLAPHLRWIVATAALTVAASIWYFAAALGSPSWPGGSSLPGLTFGTAGGLIIVFELLLWWRKKVRVWRTGRAQAWMRAHIWLGLLSVPLLIYHSGFRLGGTLTTVLMILLLVVIASGIVGLVLQQFLPRRMLDEVMAETIYSQIGRMIEQQMEEADRLVWATCGPPPGLETPPPESDRADHSPSGSHLVIGAVRSAGRVQGKVLQTRAPAAPVPGSEPLRAFYHETVAPFLRAGTASGSALGIPNRAAVMFRDLQTKLDPAAHETVNALETMCEQRRQLDRQARLHFWLHSWLWIHLPLSAALGLLMVVHVWFALKYW